MKNFKGYDPYDLAEASSKLPHSILSKLSFLNKVSPFNIRPLIGITPSDNSKSNGLWLWTYVLEDTSKYEKEIQFLLNWIEEHRSPEFTEFSMGFAFKMALSRYASEPGKTSLIITLFIVFPLIELYKKVKDQKLLDRILSFESLLDSKWMKFEDETTLWYSYLPKQKDEVYNATAKIGKFYSLLYEINPQPRYQEKILKILNYLLNKQNADGSWGYSLKAPYVDHFHTAFILDSIHHMRKITDAPIFEKMFESGLSDYLANCFTKDLRPLHFHIKRKPKDIRSRLLETEIRDSANAIMLFSKLGMKNEATKVLDWTNLHLFHPRKNYYYFFTNKWFTNKINFVRWQAWMALANVEYKLAFDEKS